MKEETKKLVEWAKAQFETMKDCDFSWKDDACKEKCGQMIELLNRLGEAERNLTTGGFVRDKAGNWLKHGDKVTFKHKDEILEGILYYDQSLLVWFCMDNDQRWYNLGEGYGEVEWFMSRFYEGANDDGNKRN